jgi:hypothetical protein
MEKGRVIEQGNHQGLLKNNGYYAKLHSYQNHTPVLRQVPVKPLKPLQAEEVVKQKVEYKKPETNNQIKKEKSESEGVDESWALELLDEQEREALLNEIAKNEHK